MFLVMQAICIITLASFSVLKSDNKDLCSPSIYNAKKDAQNLLENLKKSFENDFNIELAQNLKEIPKYNPDDEINEYDFTILLIGALFVTIDKKILERSGPEVRNWGNDIAIEAISRWKISKESLSKISDLITKYRKSEENNKAEPETKIFLKNVKNVIKEELEKAEIAVKEGNISEFIREDDDMFDEEDEFLEYGPEMPA